MKPGDLVKVIKDDEPWHSLQFDGQLGIITKVNDHVRFGFPGPMARVLLTSNGKHWFSCDDLEVQE
jgi:hypothetical protein